MESPTTLVQYHVLINTNRTMKLEIQVSKTTFPVYNINE